MSLTLVDTVRLWRRTVQALGLGLTWLCLAGTGPSLQAETNAPGVRFEQRIGEKLPLGTLFTDTQGGRHPLGDYFHGRPVVLYFGYARCPQLCSVVADGTNAALRALAPKVGFDYDVVTVSVDPTESAADARATEKLAIRQYGRNGAEAGWHYLTGTEASIRRVAEAAGFHFRYDPTTRQYAHASGFLIVTPAGVVSRYFLGVDFVASDVAAALHRAAEGKTGDSVYDLLLLCFRGDAIGGRYGALIWRVLEVSVALTVIALFGGVGWMLYQERRALALGKEAP
jgi:protein SCO1/2